MSLVCLDHIVGYTSRMAYSKIIAVPSDACPHKPLTSGMYAFQGRMCSTHGERAVNKLRREEAVQGVFERLEAEGAVGERKEQLVRKERNTCGS